MMLRHRRGWRLLQVACALVLAAALSGLFMPETAQAGGKRGYGYGGQYSYQKGYGGYSKGGYGKKQFAYGRSFKRAYGGKNRYGGFCYKKSFAKGYAKGGYAYSRSNNGY